MNQNLVGIPLEEQQALLEARKRLTFFKDGYMDVYSFSFSLFESLWLDGFDVKTPNQVLDLLLSFVTEEHIQSKKVTETFINNMTQEAYAMYPEGKTVLIHCSVLLHFIHDFVCTLGSQTLEQPRSEKDMFYSYWCKREHIYTFTYFDAFFRDFTKLLNQLPDFKAILMNMHITRHISDEDVSAFSIILEKEDRYVAVQERISKAIEQGFYLEAIALEESSISDRLSLVLYIRGQKAGTKSFAKLIEHCSEHLSRQLKTDIDSWRKSRNYAIHNLVRSSPLEEQIKLEKLDSLTSQTAQEGVKLMNQVNDWFDEFITYEMNPFIFRIVDDRNLES
ncbi:MAG: hypothetical protein COA76_12015 [Moritella sp.]|nr:MAG: hypothetical protein COA76_12015 [Moritella sp.]